MASQYDIVVVGGGSNSLTAAAYMAKGGQSVLVLEKNDHCGGGVVSISIAPGFTHDPHATGLIVCQANPAFSHDELGLFSKHGLKYVPSEASFASVFEDGTGLISYTDLDRTCQSIAMFSEKDADTYRRVANEAKAFLPLLAKQLSAPPLPFGAFLSLLEQSPQGRRLCTALLDSVYDVLSDLFESVEIKLHFMKWCGELMMSPETKGTGINFHMLLGMSHSYEAGCIEGGSHNLTKALVRSIESNGGEVRTSAEVVKVDVSGGRAVGVTLASGETIVARHGVIASIHPWRLGDYVDGVPEDVVAAARSTKLSDHGAINQQIALTEAPQFKAGAQYQDVLCVELMKKDLRGARESFHRMRIGEMPMDKISPLVIVNSNRDRTRAPAGQSALYLYHFAPMVWADGGLEAWDERKMEVADAIWTEMKAYCTNMDDAKIIARHVESPLDHHRHSNSMINGDIFGIGTTASQLLGRRPIPELAKYRVPGVKQLYLSGPFMHPGGAVTLGGRATAIAMYQDLKIDLKKGFAAL